MGEDEFDANDRVAGFSMVSVQRALSTVGFMDDRDDIKNVAEALACPPRQALRVLEELERRELVTKTAKSNQWKSTPKGFRLAFHWLPPRRFSPAIERASRSGTGTGFESVRCGILRSTEDGADVFEEAEIDPAMSVEYEGERLVEINVTQPNDYDHEYSSASVALSLYLSPSEAKIFAAALQEAIVAAEKETSRRAAQKVRHEKRAETRRVEAAKRDRESRKKAKAAPAPTLKTPPTRAARSAAPRTTPVVEERPAKRAPLAVNERPAEPDDSASDEGRAEAIASALKSLRETNRARLQKSTRRNVPSK